MTVQDAPTAELRSVVYSSTATRRFTDADLATLLLQSRMRNAAAGLTGMLLHRDGQFMQVLEGPRDAVRSTLQRIAADPRHDGVWILSDERIAARGFGSWAMGHRRIADDVRLPVEWFGSPEARERGGATPSGTRAGGLLDFFRER